MFKPCNRHLCVEVFEPDEPEDTSTVLVPEEYQVTKPIEAVRLVSKSSDSAFIDAQPGDILLVEGHMIKSVDLGGEVVHLVLENYVLGTYSE